MATKKPRAEYRPTVKDSQLVETLAAAGTRHEVIAGILGITEKMLNDKFKAELEEGLERANGRVAAALFDKAMSGGRDAFQAQRFWLTSKAGWKPDKTALELTGEDGKPLENNHKVSLDDKTIELIRRKFIGPDED